MLNTFIAEALRGLPLQAEFNQYGCSETEIALTRGKFANPGEAPCVAYAVQGSPMGAIQTKLGFLVTWRHEQGSFVVRVFSLPNPLLQPDEATKPKRKRATRHG